MFGTFFLFVPLSLGNCPISTSADELVSGAPDSMFVFVSFNALSMIADSSTILTEVASDIDSTFRLLRLRFCCLATTRRPDSELLEQSFCGRSDWRRICLSSLLPGDLMRIRNCRGIRKFDLPWSMILVSVLADAKESFWDYICSFCSNILNT